MCDKVKNQLKEKGINYKEVNAGSREGKINFRNFYSGNKEKIQREDNGAIPFPILLADGNIIQGLEKIINSLN
jgi:glutaredoxin